MPRHGGRRKPTASSSDIRWVMLDRLVHLDKVKVDEFVAAADGTLSETCYSCTDRPLIVYVRVAIPPAVSRLYLCWPDGLRPKMSMVNPPTIIAAHGHSVLFEARVPHAAPTVPPCFKGGQVDHEVDHFFQPYRLQQQRGMSSGNIGLLCCGDEAFTMAELSGSGELCLLHHALGEGNEAKDWDIKALQMPYEGIPDFFGSSWQTDVVIPFGGSYLYWVHYYLDLLFVSVGGEDTNKPYYVPMPAFLESCPSDFWAVIDADKRLPHLRPEFPTMSLVDPDVVCFVLNKNYRIYWLIVGLRSNPYRNLFSLCLLNINEEEDEVCSDDMTRRTYLEGSFLPGTFTHYLDKNLTQRKFISHLDPSEATSRI
ncbi:hypothetical protein BRADI_5g10336v3 [Brachypodium distachyon]|uniref:DUF1618 domain-containing protein n=1 Tax=Brachypodium distachyon TaxID=15368 RepID=A0A2K2CGE3_BRADI|nr:hypothetical protein BRADI_5g10336v3 [Brachypodium distachyon]